MPEAIAAEDRESSNVGMPREDRLDYITGAVEKSIDIIKTYLVDSNLKKEDYQKNLGIAVNNAVSYVCDLVDMMGDPDKALDRVEDIPVVIDAARVLKLDQDPRWSIQHSMVLAVAYFGSQPVAKTRRALREFESKVIEDKLTDPKMAPEQKEYMLRTLGAAQRFLDSRVSITN